MLAIGFLLVILSSALFNAYYPMMVVATFVVAPLPNAICARWANNEDFIDSSGSGVLDLGRFLTGFLVIMGIGMSFQRRPSSAFIQLTYNLSLTSSTCSLYLYKLCCDGNEYGGWSTDLRDNHQFHHVFPGRIRLLSAHKRMIRMRCHEHDLAIEGIV